jgi:xanthine/uracil permease
MSDSAISHSLRSLAWLSGARRIFGVLPVFVTTVLMTAIVFRLGGIDVPGTTAAIFAGVLASAFAILLQVRQSDHAGTGSMLLMGTSTMFAVASIRALQMGGVDLLALLVLGSVPVLFIAASILPVLLPRIPPLVQGTAVLWVALRFLETITFPLLSSLSFEAAQDQIVFIATLLIAFAVWFAGRRAPRPWVILFGLVAGSAVAYAFGEFDLRPIAQAHWFGLPAVDRPLPQLPPLTGVLTLFPVFLLLSLLSAIELGSAGSVALTRHTETEASADQSIVQRTLRAQALTNLVSGLLGGMPLAVARATLKTEQTSPRRAANNLPGLGAVALLILLACMPKLAALFLGLPPAVVAAGSLLLLALLLQRAFTIMFSERVRREEWAIFAALLLGVIGLQGLMGRLWQWEAINALFGQFSPARAVLVSSVLFVSMLVFVRLRRTRFQATLDLSSLDPIQEAAVRRAEKKGWTVDDCNRLELIVEEGLSWLIDQSPKSRPPARLVVEVESDREEIRVRLTSKQLSARRVRLSEGHTEDLVLSPALALKLLEATADHVQHYRFERGDTLILRMRPRAAESTVDQGIAPLVPR